VDISEIRVKLVDNRKERLLAFCTVTFHREFVVRDVKIIDGPRGPFIAMPSRKVMDRCHGCGSKNHLRAGYCNECGCELNENRAPKDARGRPRLHVDVAHPINQDCRTDLERRIIESYEDELRRSQEPGYQAPDLDHDIGDYIESESEPGDPRRTTSARARSNGSTRGAGRDGEGHAQAH
jgi:stage V sporulation protein G